MTAPLVARVLHLIDLLSTEPRGLKLQDIADRLSLPKSAAHRTLQQLSDHGVVVRTSHGVYRLSAWPLRVGQKWLIRSGLIARAQPVLDGLHAQTGETVGLGLLAGDRVDIVLRAGPEAHNDPRWVEAWPLHSTVTGLAVLAAMNPADATAIMRAHGFTYSRPVGPCVPHTLSEAEERLAQFRERGYAWGMQVSSPDYGGVSCVVRHRLGGEPTAVLSIGIPAPRVTEQRLHALAALVRSAAATLGGRVSDAAPARPARPAQARERTAALDRARDPRRG